MTKFKTGNPVPSADARDRYDNSQTFDETVNGSSPTVVTRTNKSIVTLEGMRLKFESSQTNRDSAFIQSQADRAERFEDFLSSSGYQDLGVYGPGLVISELNQVFSKDGGFYRASAQTSLPYTTSGNWGSESEKFVAVGDAVLRQDLGSFEGDSLVRSQVNYSGAAPRSWNEKGDDLLVVQDFSGFSADGDRLAEGSDNAVPVDAFLAARNSRADQYAFTSSYENDRGAQPQVPVVSETSKLLNPRLQRTNLVVGQQYLATWFRNFRFDSELGNHGPWGTPPFTVLLAGDSTVVGVGASTVAHTPDILLTNSAITRGYREVKVANMAISGYDAKRWANDGNVEAEIATNPGLYVIRYGINDGALPEWAEGFIQNIRKGLAKARALKSAAQLPIVLMSPCSTSDPENFRTEVYHELINDGLRQAARDFQCCFIDTYGYYQDSHSGSFYMDSNGAGGNGHVHPFDELYTLIDKVLADVIFPLRAGYNNINAVRNLGTSVRTIPGDAVPAYFYQGVTFDRNQGGSARQGPSDGFTYSFKNQELGLLQLNTPVTGATPGVGLSARHSFQGQSSVWLGAQFEAMGWLVAPYASTNLYLQTSLEGRAFLDGFVTIGSGHGSDVVVGNIPAQYRPLRDVYGVLGTSQNGVTVSCKIDIDGDIHVLGSTASTGTVYFGGLSYLIG